MSGSAKQVRLIPTGLGHDWAGALDTITRRVEAASEAFHRPRERFAAGDEGYDAWCECGEAADVLELALVALGMLRKQMVAAFIPNDPVAIDALIPSGGFPVMSIESSDD